MNDDLDREDDGFAARVAGAYRRPVPTDPAARERLDRALAKLPAPRRRARATAWLLEPRLVILRPAAAIAALGVVMGLGVWIGRFAAPVDPGRQGDAPVASGGATAPSTARVVQFVLVEPRASRVVVVGDFNGWDPLATPMARMGDTWTASVALPPGRHVYAFVLDGDRWVSDPVAPLAPVNEFGFRNSVVVVGESTAT